MRDDSKLFITGNLIFWSILLVLIFLVAPLFRHRVYDEERLAEWLDRFRASRDSVIHIRKDTTHVVRKDSSAIKFREPRDSVSLIKKDSVHVVKPDTASVEWYVAHFSWTDFEGRNHELAFSFDRAEYDRAATVRKAAAVPTIEYLYYQLVEASSVPLDSMTVAMARDIRRKGLVGIDVLNYVVTAIQTPKYTLISDGKRCPDRAYGTEWLDDCRPREDGKGCCNFVAPLGVFSPAEFIVQKTGDCDTKSLIAYAVLKRMGFDVAVILGNVQNGGYHAMLGVANIRPEIPTRYVTLGAGGKIYYPWEVTSFVSNHRLGNMMMWSTWTNWKVSIN